jgi:hypothetical protein
MYVLRTVGSGSPARTKVPGLVGMVLHRDQVVAEFVENLDRVEQAPRVAGVPE